MISNSTIVFRGKQNGLYHWITWGVVGIVFLLGLVLRVYDITDPPLDASYRQLNSLNIARGMYYQMLPNADPVIKQKAVAMWEASDHFEPPILERITAITYLLIGGEHHWIGRLYSGLFWMIGGLALFALARRLLSAGAAGDYAALTAFAFYTVLPFSVDLSRRFQPDAFMVMWLILSAWALHHWVEKRTWKWAMLAAAACGIAVLVKIFIVFCIAGMAVAAVITSGKPVEWLRNRQVWAMAGLMAVIPAIFYFLSIGSASQGYFLFWNVSFAHLLLQPWFYLRWFELIQFVIGLAITLVALASVTLFALKERALVAGLWVGYLLFGLAFPWQIHTHDYYSLMLVPIVALSGIPLIGLFFDKLGQQSKVWQIFFLGVAVVSFSYQAWNVRVKLVAEDQRVNWAAWEKIGAAIPQDGPIITLTGDYGVRERYFGWQAVTLWLTNSDLALASARGGNQSSDFDDTFNQATQGMDYFLITAKGELENQPLLKSKLYNNYPIFAEGDGYLIFDLRTPFPPSP